MNITHKPIEICRHNVFYQPEKAVVKQNCLTIKGWNSKSISTLKLVDKKTKKERNLKICRIDGDNIFFGCLDAIIDTSSYDIIINSDKYNFNEDNTVSVGSLLLPNVMVAIRFFRQKNFRLIIEDDNVAKFSNFVGTVNTHNTDKYGQSYIEIIPDDSSILQELLGVKDFVYVQLSDNLQHKVDIQLFLHILDSNAYEIDGEKKFKMILEDVVYNNIKEEYIPNIYVLKGLQKRPYKITIIDSKDNEQMINYDFSRSQFFFNSNSAKPAAVESLSKSFEIFKKDL